MNDELLELLAGARAALQDAALRGARDEDPTAPQPVAAHEDPARAVAAHDGAVPGDIVEDEPAPAARVAEAARPTVASGWSALASEAREEGASAAVRLQRVREELGDCRRCALCKARRSIVFGVGDPDADLVVVGEGPGEQEDLRGEPFVGPAGQMLDKMLENVLQLKREQVYILNVVKCRPPKNRNPEPDELEACRPFLEAQLAAVRPKLLLVLGTVACKALLGDAVGITRARGRWHEYAGIPVMPTFHPAYLLRKPEDKKLTFEDLKALRVRYDDIGGRR